MRLFLLAAASMCASGTAVASEPEFELRLDQKNGERTVAVENSKTGAFAVAAGAEELNLLEGGAAKAAMARLRSRPDIDIDLGDDDADASGKRKIVIHKMDYDEDDAGDEEKREVRVIKRHHRKGDDDAEINIEVEADAEIDHDLSDDDLRVEERRVILIKGAGAEKTASFIDKIDGLDDDEKAAMKETVGI